MKRICITILILSSFLYSQKINIAVADFDAQNISQSEAAVVSDFLRGDLVKIGKYRVVDRQNMALILAEQGFQQTGCTTNECAVQMGKILNVQRIIVGKISKLFGLYYIIADMVNVETGEILLSNKVSCTDPILIEGEVEKLAWYFSTEGRSEKKTELMTDEVEKRLPRIIEIKKERDFIKRRTVFKVKINRGYLDGVKEREIYEIWRAPSKLWRRKIGKLIIEKVKEIESWGKVIELAENEEVKTGDCLKLWKRRKQWSIGYRYFLWTPDEEKTVSKTGYFEFVNLTGWGISVEACSVRRENKKYISYWYDKEIKYELNLFLKHHFNYYKWTSSYLGIGISRYRIWNQDDKVFEVYHSIGFPIINFGIDFFSNSMIHIVIDGTYYYSSDDLEGVKTDFLVFSIGASLNW